MKIFGFIAILLIAVVLYIISLKIICLIIDFDRKTDMKMFNAQLEDYENDKRCAIASVTVVFIVITCGILYLFLTRW